MHRARPQKLPSIARLRAAWGVAMLVAAALLVGGMSGLGTFEAWLVDGAAPSTAGAREPGRVDPGRCAERAAPAGAHLRLALGRTMQV